MTTAPPQPVLLMVRALGPGGTERQVTEIARALDRERFEPHVGCFAGEGWRGEELRSRGVPLLEMTMRGFLSMDSPLAFRSLRRYVRHHGIQLVHTFDYPMNIFGVPAARLAGVPVVISSQRSYRDLIPPKYRAAVRISDLLADGVVVNSQAIERHLVEDYGVPRRKLHVCHNAVDTARFQPEPRGRPPELRDATLVAGTVSVLRAVKSIETLIDAFALVRREKPGMRLLIAGSGDERQALEARARAAGLADECLFRPGAEDVAGYLRAMDVFVQPSLLESLSNALMEAMACGCSVVASRVGGNPELVQHGETGLLFEKGNAADLARQLRILIHNGNLRASLAAAAVRKMREEFSLERSVGRMQAIYEGFLAAPR